jgi:hypothetical protein
MLKHFAQFSANVTFLFKAFEISLGKKASMLGDHSIGVLIGKSNWSAFGVVKRSLGFIMFMGKLSWIESRVSVFDDSLWRLKHFV